MILGLAGRGRLTSLCYVNYVQQKMQNKCLLILKCIMNSRTAVQQPPYKTLHLYTAYKTLNPKIAMPKQ